jgi:transcriptional regulator EpsA
MPSDVCHENAQETFVHAASDAVLAATQPLPCRDDVFAPLDTIELEALALNQETSLRVYSDHHFFSWTQGVLQNLIRHEALLCVLRNGESERPLVEGFTTASVEPEHLCHLYCQNSPFAEKLMKDWEKNFFQPVRYDLEPGAGAGAGADLPASALARELERIGVGCIVVHGTHDANGRMGSLFIFACRTEDAGPGAMHMIEMMTPFIHAAWVRAKVCPGVGEGAGSAHSAARDLLTLREQEVLKWVCLGKSNIEIGMILGISALTVKNHVQEILRRLNVQNRAQAVGKAFNLHILSC